jgi:hypothetical protein
MSNTQGEQDMTHDRMNLDKLDAKLARLHAAVDDAGTLPPAIDWKDIAKLAQTQPAAVETFLPRLETYQLVSDDSPWSVNGRVF